MTDVSASAVEKARRVRTAPLSICLAVVLAVSAAVQIVRWYHVWQYGDLHVVTGEEGPNFYVMWKILNGFPAYSDPFQPPFNLSFYNLAFYRVYAFVMRLFGVHDGGIVNASRLITFVFAVVGAGIGVGVVGVAVRRRLTSTEMAIAGGLCALTWLGPGSTAWWSVSARPDMAALCLASAGLFFYARCIESGRLGPGLIAGLAFCAAWAFKQTTVGIFGGCVCYALLFQRRVRDAALLATPVLLFLAFLILTESRAYWDNVLWAPLVNPVEPSQIPARVLEVALPNLLCYLLPLVWLAAGGWRMLKSFDAPPVITLLFVVAACATLLGVVTIGKEGASRNYLFESLIVMTVLCAVVFTSLLNDLARVSLWPALVLTASTALLPALTLMFPRVNAHGLHWNLVFVDREAYETRKRLAADVAGLDKPAFVRDDILSLPWHSTNGRYPALIIDSLWHARAARNGRLGAGGLGQLLRDHTYKTLLLERGDPLVDSAVASGYVSQCDIHTVGGNGRPVDLVQLGLQAAHGCQR